MLYVHPLQALQGQVAAGKHHCKTGIVTPKARFAQSNYPCAVGRAGAFPALNVGTWAEAVEIYAFAPGIDPKSIEISVEKGLLTLSGERKVTPRAEGDKVNVYARERYSGPFRRVVSLPDDSDPERVEASYRNGVLKIVVPKRESAKPRQIAVSSAA